MLHEYPWGPILATFGWVCCARSSDRVPKPDFRNWTAKIPRVLLLFCETVCNTEWMTQINQKSKSDLLYLMCWSICSGHILLNIPRRIITFKDFFSKTIRWWLNIVPGVDRKRTVNCLFIIDILPQFWNHDRYLKGNATKNVGTEKQDWNRT